MSHQITDNLAAALPTFFESVVTGTGPDGSSDLSEGIRRTGFVGVGGVNPSSSLHATSLATKWVNHFGPANYATNNLDYSLRFAQGCPAVGVTLHAAATVPGQIMTIVNSSLFAQTITNPPIPLNGVGTYPTLAIGDSITIQSIDGFWCVIDSGTGAEATATGFDFFRSDPGQSPPNGVNDATKGIWRTGFVGIGQAVQPISPLSFGDLVRNDVIRLFGSVNPSAHQFYGFGINPSTFRYQVDGLAASHAFYGATSATTSRQYFRAADNKATIGDPLSPNGTGHWTIENIGDDGGISFNSPNIAAGANKIQAQIWCDAFSGNANTTGGALDFRTATSVAYAANGFTVTAVTPGAPLQSRLLVGANGDILVSRQGAGYGSGTGSLALMTVNGAIRVRGGAIPLGSVRAFGGIVWGAGDGNGATDITNANGDTDGGITSLGDGNTTFYNNGVISGRIDAGVWSKPGGGTWAATSDARTKKIVTNLTTGGWIDKVLQLQPVEFEYNGLAGTRSGTTYTGLVAQDVQKIFPTWVTESQEKIDNTPVLQIDPSPLVYALVECVRELKLEIDKLKAGISGPTATTTATTATTATTVVTAPPATSTTTAPLSVNMVKVSRLTLMTEIQLTAIGFTAAQAKMFIAGSGAIKTGVATGTLLEADALRLLSALLSGMGLTLSGVLSKL